MYQSQLNFAKLCATSAFGIFWQHLIHPNMLVCSVNTFLVCFDVWIILHHYSLLHEVGFSKVKICLH